MVVTPQDIVSRLEALRNVYVFARQDSEKDTSIDDYAWMKAQDAIEDIDDALALIRPLIK